MLACTALVGCSDDVIEGMDNQEQQVSKEPAYLTVSFSTGGSSSRSTADDANNKGDTHEKEEGKGQEHSGHINTGTDAENAINQVLLVVKHSGNAQGFAKLYDAPGNGFPTITDHVNGKTCHQIETNIELSTSEYPYDVLVVANPYEKLYNAIDGIEDGVKDASSINKLYNAILTGQTPRVDAENTTEENLEKGGSWNNFATNVVHVENNTLNGIMMANKEMCSVTLKNAGDNVIADVEIERAAAKVTFRQTENSIYKVEVPDLSTVVVHTKIVDGITYNKATLNNKSYWVTFTKGADGTTGSYTYYDYDDDEQEKFNEAEPQPVGTPEFVYVSGQYGTSEWYVKLVGYALVNLSKQAYNVRHTIAENSPAVAFGKLNGSNFLYTPNWEASFNGGINNVSFENNAFPTDFTTSPWFYNTLANVSADSKGKANVYFREFKNELTGTDNNQNVTAEDKYHDETNSLNPEIGNLLAYCLENTTDIKHQMHGLSTGITFKAQIFSDANCTNGIKKLYRYNGYLFESLDAIETAWGIDLSVTDDSPADKLAEAGIVKYDGNTCYYYTTEIKHFDNGIYPGDTDENGKLITETLGNMEFAIMRNNIYSLSVSGVNVIGDPWVDPIPNTPDEVGKSKLEVHAVIEPWIVRYHDIEFN